MEQPTDGLPPSAIRYDPHEKFEDVTLPIQKTINFQRVKTQAL